MFELSPRLRTIAEQVPFGARLADIGTDHAYLPVWLLMQERISSAIASDLREGPLSRGIAVARQWQTPSDKISFRCCDGLLGMERSELDTIVIAGMGGDTIAHTLSGVTWSNDPDLLFLLQPMSSIPELRQWLQENTFRIEEEKIALEQSKYYVILKVRAGSMEPLSLGERWVGRQSKDSPENHRTEYICDVIRRRNRALNGIKNAVSKPPKVQVDELNHTLKELHQMREEWLSWQR
ncbi:MAG: SAM-dependent methyltransferase [Evtepia sp.]|nr:SAM-dependent methyltransferase [Evtepia sp.]